MNLDVVIFDLEFLCPFFRPSSPFRLALDQPAKFLLVQSRLMFLFLNRLKINNDQQ